MKFGFSLYFIAFALAAALAIPMGLTAQDNDHAVSQHHHYHLVDIGTFGGPESHFNPGSGNDFFPFASVLNGAGMMAGFSDTTSSDPFQPFCFWNCVATHAFRARRSGHLTDLGTLPGPGNSSAALAISNNGLIAGVSENGEMDPLYTGLPEVRAVLWNQGTMTDLGTLPGGGYESVANSVNSSGQVVGSALNTVPDANTMQPSAFWLWGGIPTYPYQTRAFIWDKKNGMRDLGTLSGGSNAQAILINDKSQVVGYSYTSSNPSPSCATAGFALTTGSYIWDKSHGMMDLGNLGGTCTLASDLNNQGQVIGLSFLPGDLYQRAFLWEHGSIHDLGGSLGGGHTGAFVINDEGYAVGFATLPGDTLFHATIWKHNGDMTDLGTLGSDLCSYATGINARGQVVGASILDCNDNFRAFLWEHGSIVDLNSLIPSGSPLYLTQIYTINDHGEIAGEGDDADGDGHAFLLIPCDENHSNVAGCDYSMVDAIAELHGNVAQAIRSTKRNPAFRAPFTPGRSKFHQRLSKTLRQKEL